MPGWVNRWSFLSVDKIRIHDSRAREVYGKAVDVFNNIRLVLLAKLKLYIMKGVFPGKKHDRGSPFSSFHSIYALEDSSLEE